MDKKKKKILRLIIKSIISIGFIAWLVFVTDWREVRNYLQEISIWQIIMYYAAVIIGIIISSYKWKQLALYKNMKLPFFDFFKLYLAGTFINNFMPSFVGGDAYKAYQLGKDEKKYKEAASTVVVDRMTGLLVAMLLSVFFGILNFKSISQNTSIVMIDLVVLVLLLWIVVFLLIRKKTFWKNFSTILPKKVVEFMRILNDFADNGILLKSVLFSFSFAFVGLALSNYILFWALGAEIKVLDYLSVIFIISIVSSIPVSVNNIGIKEWAYVTFFGIFGVTSSLAVTVALLGRVLQMLLSFTALPFYLKNKNK